MPRRTGPLVAMLSSFLLGDNLAIAQLEASNWFFGSWAGLDFNCDPPQPRRSGMYYTIESCASISDATGQLLFYTQGDSVYDRQHHMMPNGFGIGILSSEFGSSTQGSLIVPRPGNDPVYYIFTVDCAENDVANGFRYSIVDISLNGGFGEVTSKFNLIAGPVTEKLAAVRHSNGEDVWVLVHEYGTDAFLAYLVTSAGISATPIVSNTGFVQYLPDTLAPYSMTRGYMKFSPNGERLIVLSASDQHPFVHYPELFSFDASTGVVALDYTIVDPDFSGMFYGASFSPNSDLLYFTGGWYGHRLLQYDATQSNAADFMASEVVLVDDSLGLAWPIGAAQIGPDGKIYLATHSPWIDVINQPNLPGIACGYEQQAIDLYACTYANYGLPNFIESYFQSVIVGSACPPDSIHASFSLLLGTGTVCAGDTIQFMDMSSSYPEDVGRWSWSFDDPGSGSNNSASSADPYHVFLDPGIYEVQLIAGIEMLPFYCKSDTVTLTLNVIPCVEGIMAPGDHRHTAHSMDDLFQLADQQSAILTISDLVGRVLVHGDPSTVRAWYTQQGTNDRLSLIVYQLDGPDHNLQGKLLLGVNN